METGIKQQFKQTKESAPCINKSNPVTAIATHQPVVILTLEEYQQLKDQANKYIEVSPLLTALEVIKENASRVQNIAHEIGVSLENGVM